MKIQGDWYPQDRTLDVAKHVPEARQRLEELTPGDWFPVLVESVTAIPASWLSCLVCDAP